MPQVHVAAFGLILLLCRLPVSFIDGFYLCEQIKIYLPLRWTCCQNISAVASTTLESKYSICRAINGWILFVIKWKMRSVNHGVTIPKVHISIFSNHSLKSVNFWTYFRFTIPVLVIYWTVVHSLFFVTKVNLNIE